MVSRDSCGVPQIFRFTALHLFVFSLASYVSFYTFHFTAGTNNTFILKDIEDKKINVCN
jgi:hypothetical protein